MASIEGQSSIPEGRGRIAVLLIVMLVAISQLATAGELPEQLSAMTLAKNGTNGTGVQPPATPKIYGRTIGEWSAQWWNWGLQFPSDTNPIFNDGDVDCTLGQSGKVWFLAGNFGGVSERHCSVKANKALFFPILNVVFWGPEDVPACGECPIGSDPGDCPPECEAELRALSKTFADPGDILDCSVNGVSCVYSQMYVRMQSPAFVLSLPEDGILAEFGVEPGDRPVAIADGTWVMLPGLPHGEHVVHFSGEDPSTGFLVDVTYYLSVGD